jgi:lipoate-protein ligase A
MRSNIYLLVADTITAVKNESERPTIEEVIEALAEAFQDNDPNFDRVQFLSDCELAVAQ